jgi:tetratricopeptide (TPR) repeat protein
MINLRQRGALVLIAFAAFLAPLLGGQLGLDPVSLAPGTWLIGALGGFDAPLGSHFIIVIPIYAALIVCLFRRFIQLPTTGVGAPLSIFFGLTVISVAVASHRWQSLVSSIEWLTYAFAFMAAVAAAGRKKGPTLIISTLAVSTSVLALKALQEFGETRAAMFAGWNNPNALAGMLLIGFFCCLGLAMSDTKESMVAGLASVLIGFAILLTSSQGALLALLGSLVLFSILGILWAPKKRAWLGRALAVAVLVGGLSTALKLSQPTQAPSAISAGNASTAVQSVGFRKLLFSTAVDLVRANPVGYGSGGFRFVSAKPGKVTGTVFAHNNLLQAAVDVSPVGAVAFLIAGVVWLTCLFKRAKRLPPETAGLRAGVVCAVSAVFAHGMVDSTLSYFGIGISFFLLIGVGLLLANDSVAPEAVPKFARMMAVVMLIIVASCQFIIVRGEALKNNAKFAIEKQDLDSARSIVSQAVSWAPADGVAHWLSAMVSPPQQRMASLRRSAELCPLPRTFRAIARLEAETGNLGNALSALDNALIWDPNNLPALYQKMELLRAQGSEPAAVEVAQKMVQIESSSYFTVRSLPELVPLETYRARAFMASKQSQRTERISLLLPALEGYLDYARQTVPKVKDFAKAGLPGFGGESVQDAKTALEEGLAVAVQLAADGSLDPDTSKAQGVFTEALAGLRDFK